MATAAEIADLITQGIAGPTGPDDSGWHVGKIITWSATTGLNSVLVNNTVLTNMRALAPSIGTEYHPGQSVLIVRKQTQYFILGPVQVPGSTGSSPPNQVDAAGGVLTGTAGVWRDLDAGGVSPSFNVTLAPYQRILLMWGADRVQVWGASAELSIVVTSPPGTNRLATPGNISGSTVRVANQISLSNYLYAPAFKTFITFASSGKTDPTTELATPGVNQLSLKYRFNALAGAAGAGTPTASIGTPWILAVPF